MPWCKVCKIKFGRMMTEDRRQRTCNGCLHQINLTRIQKIKKSWGGRNNKHGKSNK